MAQTTTKLPITTETNKPASTLPWPPFESLRNEIDRLFDNFGFATRPGRSMFDFDLSQPGGDWAIAPAVDVAEKDGDFEITAELPGLDAKDLNVTVANGTLTIKGEKKESREEQKKDYYLSERRYGSFLRSFELPESVEADKIAATFTNGVLTLKLPKSAKAQHEAKKIEVKAA
jgi:HSP20 family protein